MSPEIWNNRPYDSSSDIWSLGCMFYELAALRPPFIGDSFPQLKRAVLSGRYQPIPRKYSDALHKVIGMMLKLSPRERPSAEALLKSPDLASKLQYDDEGLIFTLVFSSILSYSFTHLGVTFAKQENNIREAKMRLMETIKVPQNLRKLSDALPKPCYPDVRPNSPTAWTVAEQDKQAKAKPPMPPAPLLKEINGAENIAPQSTDPSRDDSASRVYVAKEAVNMNAVNKEKIPTALAAMAEYYSRRPLAPIPVPSQVAAPVVPQNPYNPYHVYEPTPAYKQPSYAVPGSHAHAQIPSVQYRPRQPQPPSLLNHGGVPSVAPSAGYPARVQHYNRMW